MSRNNVMRLAWEAGCVGTRTWWGPSSKLDKINATEGMTFHFTLEQIERFAALVAAHEREACAITCEQTTASWTQHLYNEGVMDCVKAIRARS